MSEENVAQPRPEKDHVYDAQVVIEQFVANSAFREATKSPEFRNAIQYIAGVVAGCADMTANVQAVRVSIVSDNGAMDFRYTLRKAGPQIIKASPDMLGRLDKG